MKFESKRVLSFILALAVLASIAVFFYILNTKTPLYKDDYSYSYTFAVRENKFKIENFEQVIESQINHYKVMNGRAVAHTLAQSFLIFNKSVFNILNTIAFILLIYLISVYASGTYKVRAQYLLAVFALLWLFTPRFGESFLWLTGASNYLWGMILVFVCLLTVKFAYLGKNKLSLTTKIVLTPLYFIFAFIAGDTGENTAASLIVISIIYIAMTFVKKRKIPFMSIVGLFGNISGFLFLLLAPGQRLRLANNGGSGDFGIWLNRFCDISVAFFERLGILLIIALILLVFGFVRKRKLSELCETAVFFIGTLTSVYSMVLSPYFPDRVWSGPCILMTATLLSLVKWAFADFSYIFKITSTGVLSCFLAILFIFTYVDAYRALSLTYGADLNRQTQIKEYKKAGISTVTLESIYGHSKYDAYDAYGDLNEDYKTWPNTAIAMYYGLTEVNKKS